MRYYFELISYANLLSGFLMFMYALVLHLFVSIGKFKHWIDLAPTPCRKQLFYRTSKLLLTDYNFLSKG